MSTEKSNNQEQSMNLNGVQIVCRNVNPQSASQNNSYQIQHLNNFHPRFQLQNQPFQSQNMICQQNKYEPHLLQYQQNLLKTQQELWRQNYFPTISSVKYAPTEDPKHLIKVNPVYTPSQSLPHQQQFSQPSSMITPPMEKPPQRNQMIPPWQSSVQQNFALPPVGANLPPIYAMSSFLIDDRVAETPAPMPVECTLDTPDTPSPSLPSHSPPLDTSLDPSFFLMSQFSEAPEDNLRKRRASSDLEQLNHKKRHRRTKAEIAADQLSSITKSMKPCHVNLKKITLSEQDMPARVFVGSEGLAIKTNLPRVPRMKIVPKSFNRISRIGFMRTKHGIAFSCMDQCKFKTYVPEKFQRHLRENHEVIQGIGFTTCTICRGLIKSGSTLYEFIHMLKYHLSSQEILGTPVQDILYSVIKNSDDESESEDEMVDNITHRTTPEPVADQENLQPSLSLEGDNNSTEIHQDAQKDKSPGNDLNNEDVDKLLDDFTELIDLPDIPPEEDFPDTPLTSQDNEKDPDYVPTPNEDVESEDETPPFTAVTSDDDYENCSNATQIATDTDSEESELNLPFSPKNSLFVSAPLESVTCKRKIKPKRKGPDFIPFESNESEDDPGIDDGTISDEGKAVQGKKSPILLSLKKLKEKEKKEAREKRKSRKNKRKKLKSTSSKSVSEESDKSIGDNSNQKRLRIISINQSSDESKKPTMENESCYVKSAFQNEVLPSHQLDNLNNTKNSLESSKSPEEPDFLTRIPFSVLEKFKQAREQSSIQPEASQAAQTGEFITENSNVQIFENVVSSSDAQEPALEESPARVWSMKSKLPKELISCQPTARKSTSKQPKSQAQIFKEFNIKRCTVNLVSSDERLKLIIRNARESEFVTVETDEDASETFNVGTAIYSQPEPSETPFKEINFDENEAESHPDLNRPLPQKDFPRVLRISVPETTIKSAKNERETNSSEQRINGSTSDFSDLQSISRSKLTLEVKESDDDLFFDCENIDPPQSISSSDDDIPTSSNDQNDSNPLVNLAKLYPWIDDETVAKWSKLKSCEKAWLEESSLISTYKCMSIKCFFFTESIKEFKKHVKSHRSTDRHFLCCFCLSDELQPEHLFQHLQEEHKNDRFQCNECMYRSCEKLYCEIHIMKFHQKFDARGRAINEFMIHRAPPQQTGAKKERKSLKVLLESKLDDIVKQKQCKCEFCST